MQLEFVKIIFSIIIYISDAARYCKQCRNLTCDQGNFTMETCVNKGCQCLVWRYQRDDPKTGHKRKDLYQMGCFSKFLNESNHCTQKDGYDICECYLDNVCYSNVTIAPHTISAPQRSPSSNKTHRKKGRKLNTNSEMEPLKVPKSPASAPKTKLKVTSASQTTKPTTTLKPYIQPTTSLPSVKNASQQKGRSFNGSDGSDILTSTTKPIKNRIDFFKPSKDTTPVPTPSTTESGISSSTTGAPSSTTPSLDPTTTTKSEKKWTYKFTDAYMRGEEDFYHENYDESDLAEFLREQIIE